MKPYFKTAKTASATILACLLGISGLGPARAAEPLDGASQLPELDCVIEPSEIVDVGSAVAGVIESIHFERGDVVEKGAVVAELDSGVERAAVEVARVRGELTTGIELRRLSAGFSARKRSRNEKLYDRNAISAHDMDQLQTEMGAARLQLRQEKENKRIAKLELRRTREALARRTIRSPVSGVVMERFKSIGEHVEDTPVLRVAQLDPLHVEVIVPVEFMGRIRPGLQAEVTPDVPGYGKQLATVVLVDRVADAATGTFGVRLSLANPDYTIAAGLRCRVGFVRGDTPVTLRLSLHELAMPNLIESRRRR